MHSKQIKDKAYRAFRETRNLEAVSRLIGIPTKTIYRWKDKYNWDQRAEEDDRKALVSIDSIQDKDLEKFCKEFSVDKGNAETLQEVKAVSKICMATILGNDNDLIDNINLQPKSFKEAVSALKICWDAKQKIFQNVGGGGEAKEQQKVDFLGSVSFHFGEKHIHADNERDSGEIVHQSTPRLE